MTVRFTRLDNGLTVATDTIPHVETVALGAFIGVGTRHEAPEVNGIAHLLEHMAFKGTIGRSALDIAEEIESVGGHLNAYTGRESTAYYAKVLKEHAPLALDIISDILVNPSFEEAELQRERQVILQEIGQANDTPDDIIFDHFQETAYPGQGLGRPVLGRPEIVSELGRRDLEAYMGRHYGAERMVISAAGNIDHDRFVDMARKAFAELPRVDDSPVEEARYIGGEYRETRALEQVHVILGTPGVGYRHKDYYATALLATLLGGGMSSRLFQKVREERGLVYSIFAFHAAATDSGLLGIYAGTGDNEVSELLPIVCDEISEVARHCEQEELERARAQIKAGILMSQESTSGRCEQLANHLLVYGRPLETREIVEQIEAVDTAAVERLATQMVESQPTLTSLGPVGNVETLDIVRQRFSESASRLRSSNADTTRPEGNGKEGETHPNVMLSWLRSMRDRPLKLEYERVLIRPPRARDWREWAELRQNSRAFLEPWEPAWPHDTLSRSAFRNRVHRSHEEMRADQGYSFLIFRREDGALVGGVTLSNIRRGVAQAASLGYWIGEPYARQGYMSEALTALLDFCFDMLGLHRVEAACLPHNTASQAVLRKVGFTEEGYARRYLKINGVWEDHVLFSILRQDARGLGAAAVRTKDEQASRSRAAERISAAAPGSTSSPRSPER